MSEDASQHGYEEIMRAFAEGAQPEEVEATRAFVKGYAEGAQAAREAHYVELREAAGVVVSALRTVGGSILRFGALFADSESDGADGDRGADVGVGGDGGPSGDLGGGFDAAVYINYDG